MAKSRKKSVKKIISKKRNNLKKGKKNWGWVKNAKSPSDTSIENTSPNESLENCTEAFGEISINSHSEFTITLLNIILFIK